MEQQKVEQLAKAEKEQELKIAAEKEAIVNRLQLNTCLEKARAVYDLDWAAACKSVANSVNEQLQECIKHEEYFTALRNELSDPILYCDDSCLQAKIQNKCNAVYKPNFNFNCELPSYRAESINKYLKENKDECFKKYPQ